MPAFFRHTEDLIIFRGNVHKQTMDTHPFSIENILKEPYAKTVEEETKTQPSKEALSLAVKLAGKF